MEGQSAVGKDLLIVLNDCTHGDDMRPELKHKGMNERIRSPRPSVTLCFRLKSENGLPPRLFGFRLFIKPLLAEPDRLLA